MCGLWRVAVEAERAVARAAAARPALSHVSGLWCLVVVRPPRTSPVRRYARGAARAPVPAVPVRQIVRRPPWPVRADVIFDPFESFCVLWYFEYAPEGAGSGRLV